MGMYTCPECGGRAVETTEFLVCGSCGLVLGQLIEEGCYWPNATWVLFEAAERFGVDYDECLKLYRTAVGRGVARGAALAVAIYASIRRRGEHVPLKRICEWLNSRGIAANHAQALKILFRLSGLIGRPRPEELVKVYAAKLGLDGEVTERALEIARLRTLGGRDPHFIAIAAIYLAAEGRFTYYKLAKVTGRSVSRIWDAVQYLCRLQALAK